MCTQYIICVNNIRYSYSELWKRDMSGIFVCYCCLYFCVISNFLHWYFDEKSWFAMLLTSQKGWKSNSMRIAVFFVKKKFKSIFQIKNNFWLLIMKGKKRYSSRVFLHHIEKIAFPFSPLLLLKIRVWNLLWSYF